MDNETREYTLEEIYNNLNDKGIACPNCGAFMPDGLKNVLG